MEGVPETTAAGCLEASLYLLLSEACGVGDGGRTVKTQTIETSDEGASPIEPVTGGGS